MDTAKTGRMLRAFLAEQDGVTAIEYALVATLVFCAILVSVALLGDSVKTLYDDVATKVTNAMP